MFSKFQSKSILNFGGNKIAAQDGKVGCNTVEYTTTFLYSDWLYFLWHGINNYNILMMIQTLHDKKVVKKTASGSM